MFNLKLIMSQTLFRDDLLPDLRRQTVRETCLILSKALEKLTQVGPHDKNSSDYAHCLPV